jgi:hypothetical protein
MAAHVKYTSELRERFGYSATWLPMVSVRLGDVGRLEGYVYEPLGSLGDYGVQFRRRKGTSMGTVDYVSGEGVQVSSRSHADVAALDPAAMGGALSVKFSRQGAVLFRAEGCQSEVIDGQNALETEIVGLHERGAWPDGLVVVTEVVHASWATILISGGSDATIELRGTADLVGLAAAGSSLEVIRSQDIATQIIARGGLTPLFRAKGIRKRRLVGKAAFRRRGDDEPSGPEQTSAVQLSEVDYEHFA